MDRIPIIGSFSDNACCACDQMLRRRSAWRRGVFTVSLRRSLKCIEIASQAWQLFGNPVHDTVLPTPQMGTGVRRLGSYR